MTEVNTTNIFYLLEKIILNLELSWAVLNITNTALKQKDYLNIIYTSNSFDETDDILLQQLHLYNGIPIFILDSRTYFNYYMWMKFSKEYFAIARLEGVQNKDQDLLQNMWRNLFLNHQSHTLLIIPPSVNDFEVNMIFRYCAYNKAMNIKSLQQLGRNDIKSCSLQIFPELKIIQTQWNWSEIPVYTNLVSNMHGYKLKIITDQVEPKNFMRCDSKGNAQIRGYVGLLLDTFAAKRNATLTFPLLKELGPNLFIDETDNLVENNTFDISAVLTYPRSIRNISYTFEYDYMDLCLMVPVEETLPSYLSYVIVFDYVTLSLVVVALFFISFTLALSYWAQGKRVSSWLFLYNANILSGLLGNAFNMERYYCGIRSWIYIIVALTGIVFNTSYITYLQAFKTAPPTESAINSLQDINKKGLQIAMYKEEFEVMRLYEGFSEFEPYIKLINSYAEYFQLRDSFDNRYAFPVPSAKWISYKEQQKFFAHPRFRLTNLCILHNTPMLIPLQANSLLTPALNILIGQANQAGLVQYWKTLSFLELVQMGRIKIIDPSMHKTFEPMKPEDLKLVFSLFESVLALTVIIFLVELYWPHKGKFSKRVWRKLTTFSYFK